MIKKEARKRRELEDLKWSACFENIADLAGRRCRLAASAATLPGNTSELLRNYVARLDQKSLGQKAASATDREELEDLLSA